MAKMKGWAVEVTVTHRRTLFVQARRADGAIERLKTEDGWREATVYEQDDVLPSWPSGDVVFGTPHVLP